MRVEAILGLAAAIAVLAGCGGEKPKAADAAPFVAALDDYLKAGSMDMRVDKIESIEIAGDSATVKARMAPKDDLYKMRPLWTVTFTKQGEAWKVAKWSPDGGG